MQKPYSGFPQDFSEVASKLKVKSSILCARLTLDVSQINAETMDEPLVEMNKLPDSLSKLYAKQLEKVSNKDFAKRILQCLASCRRPITKTLATAQSQLGSCRSVYDDAAASCSQESQS